MLHRPVVLARCGVGRRRMTVNSQTLLIDASDVLTCVSWTHEPFNNTQSEYDIAMANNQSSPAPVTLSPTTGSVVWQQMNVA